MAKEANKFTLTVPMDATGVKDAARGEDVQEVKVVAKDKEGTLHSRTVELNARKTAEVRFDFRANPGPLRVAVGPADATDEELMGLQTLTANVSERQWGGESAAKISPILIHPYYWYWWLRWCRTFTIRGTVLCPGDKEKRPVVGAKVCAYDVDWWWFWCSKQLIGCDTTDINGAFEIKFRWCCGWWPWWWWQHRVWDLDDGLSARIGDVLRKNPELQLSQVGHQPSLAAFAEILDDEGLKENRLLTATDTVHLPGLRDRLLERLPLSSALESLRIWPWYPWHPWRDCTPDVIFKVTQDCETPGEVILEENCLATRWNIPNPLDVTLDVLENACCRPEDPEEDDCLIIDSVCNYPFSDVGGNPGAAATPVGYQRPGPVPVNTHDYHRPFAGVIPIWKDPQDLVGVDYYEVEYHDGIGWAPLPLGAALDFRRRYWDSSSPPPLPALFDFTVISGHNVVKTRQYYETTDPNTWPNEPGVTNAWWLSTNYSLLLPLDTRKFADGTYKFRVVGWQESGGSLVNPVVLPVCNGQKENEFVLTFDNRVITAPALHDASHFCGQGVHLCTTEPDTHITEVRINGDVIAPCDIGELKGDLEIEFLAKDVDKHLAYYTLAVSWGLNQSRDLLDLPGASVVALGGTATGWYSGQKNGNYGRALSQSATAPEWEGGTYKLTVPAKDAFLEPCCYQLELWAFKRTIVGSSSGLNQNYAGACHTGYHVHVNGNKTEYSIGVGLCPPPVVKAEAEVLVSE